MSFVNDLFGKFWDMKSAINNKKGVVSISKNGPSPDEIQYPHNQFLQVQVTSKLLLPNCQTPQ